MRFGVDVNEFGSRLVDFVDHIVDSSEQKLVQQQDGNGDRQTGCCRHEGFVNTSRQHRGLCRSAAGRCFLKSVNHPVDGSQQTKQRRNGGNDRYRPQTPFHLIRFARTDVFDRSFNDFGAHVRATNSGFENMPGCATGFFAVPDGVLAGRIGIPRLHQAIEKPIGQDPFLAQCNEPFKTQRQCND